MTRALPPRGNPSLRPGEEIHGFLVRAATPCPDLPGTAYTLAHQISGARFLHLHGADSENLFAIVVATPAPDNSGLTHLLEHVLVGGGSRAFPVRYPLQQMASRSLVTHLKATTVQDHTRFSVTSVLPVDLHNVLEVIFDAVFHPLLDESSFRRDAHRLTVGDDDHDELALSGMAFSELQGLAGQPLWRLQILARKSLFPDTPLGLNAAGDPELIPEVTLADLRRYHECHYHPDNCWLIAYGDIPTRDHLTFLAERLGAFERRGPPPPFTRQPRWSSPRSTEDVYPISPGEPREKKTYLLLGWLLGDASDPADYLALQVLGEVLLGHDGAPLRRAIDGAELGQGQLPLGLRREGPEAIFLSGIQGSEASQARAFVDCVQVTLERLCREPPEPEAVIAALRRVAYTYLEVQPRHPLRIRDRVLACWPYGGDPLSYLGMRPHLAALERRCREDPGLVGRLIRERLLDNPHRITTVLRPDSEWQTRADERIRRRLSARRDQLSSDEIRRLAEQDAEPAHETDDPSILPLVRVGDLPPPVTVAPIEEEELGPEAVLLHHDSFTGGLCYLQLHLGLPDLPPDEWRHLALYTTALTELGAAGLDHARLAQRIAESTGDLSAGLYIGSHQKDADRLVTGLRLRLKTREPAVETALQVLRDLLFALDLEDTARLRQVLTQAAARLRIRLLHQGFGTALQRATRNLAPAHQLTNLTTGVPLLALYEELKADFAERGDELRHRLELTRDLLLRRRPITACHVGPGSAPTVIRTNLARWVDALAPVAPTGPPRSITLDRDPVREGLCSPTPVAHCAYAVPARHASHADAPLLALAAGLLQIDHIQPEIRARGGAYGAWCHFDGPARTWMMGSQSDPAVARTLQIFAGLREHVRRVSWTRTDLERAIIGLARQDCQPLRPGRLGDVILHQRLTGDTARDREQRRARMVAASPAEVKRALLEMLEEGAEHAAVCLIAPRETLDEASRQLADRPLERRDLQALPW